MRVGILHNAYRFRGGEERVAESEASLLRDAGHHVSQLTIDNREKFAQLGPKLRAMSQAATGWNRHAAEIVSDWVRMAELDVVHVHNLYPFITPAALESVLSMGVPVVMTLHNFRPLCAAGTLTRNGAACDKCITGSSRHAIQGRCYRGSILQSLSWAIGRGRASATRIWDANLIRFIVPSEHMCDSYVRSGFPKHHLIVRPHFTDIETRDEPDRQGLIVAGRVEHSKGVPDLVKNWPEGAPRLTVVGVGPNETYCRAFSKGNVRFTGQLGRADLAHELASARVLISASQLPETFGLTLVEAAACRTPSVAFAVGGHASIIENGVTGVLAEQDNVPTLIRAAIELHNRPTRARIMGIQAYGKYRRTYTPEVGRDSLVRIYRNLLDRRIRSVA